MDPNLARIRKGKAAYICFIICAPNLNGPGRNELRNPYHSLDWPENALLMGSPAIMDP